MSTEQVAVFAVLVGMLALFVWGRWRYDVVALGGLLVVAAAGIVPADDVFAGLGNPAVVTVGAVLVLSRAWSDAGAVDGIARLVARAGGGSARGRVARQVLVLTAAVTVLSAVMNNVGALAILMPVAIFVARRAGWAPGVLLMPLAFGSLLGGTLTLIGTPPNLLVSQFREDASGAPFAMFDFAPVGLSIALVGVAFLALVGWRLVPQRETAAADELFDITDYTTEVRVMAGGPLVGQTMHTFLVALQKEVELVVLALVRGGRVTRVPSTFEVLQAGDILLVESDTEGLKALTRVNGLELVEAAKEPPASAPSSAATSAATSAAAVASQGPAGGEPAPQVAGTSTRKPPPARDLELVEAIVAPGSWLVGQSATSLSLRERHRINVLAVARQGRRLTQRIGRVRFALGDILLVQGDNEAVRAALDELGCLPLAQRGLRLRRRSRMWSATTIFALALALVATGALSAPVGFTAGALVMVLARHISLRDAYEALEVPILVLLAAMIPIGHAVETTGGARLLAGSLAGLVVDAPAVAAIAALMVATMLLTNVVNNAAAAILVAPIALELARTTGHSVDAYLMAVAIGASCAFMTPIGHQSNTLVMTPGGYRFGDYWRVGLPLSLLVVAVAVPVIGWWWPSV
jgi:di/tricarboxylate transporter